MLSPLRILFVEDQDNDALLIQRLTLRRRDFNTLL
jgi:hypothetical protein